MICIQDLDGSEILLLQPILSMKKNQIVKQTVKLWTKVKQVKWEKEGKYS